MKGAMALHSTTSIWLIITIEPLIAIATCVEPKINIFGVTYNCSIGSTFEVTSC